MALIRKTSVGGWLLAVLVLYTGLGFWYIQTIPPYEGPDEPEHFAYVSRLAEGQGFPPQGEAAWDTPVRQEASQPPLYYLLASIPARLVGVDQPPAEYRPNPHFPSGAPGTVHDNKNVAIHYPADTADLRGGWLALYLARGVSLLSGLVSLVATYGLIRELAPDRPATALASAAFVALLPQAIFMGSLVSNDMLAAATAALTLWGIALIVRRGPTPRRALLTGIAFGLALLSKSSNLALALPLLAGFLWTWLEPGRGQPTRSGRIRVVLPAGLFLLAGAMVVAGWWYIRSWQQYGSPLGLSTHFQAPWAVGSPADRIRPDHAWREVFFSFWAAFGWGNIKYPGWVYYVLGALALTALVGLSLEAWRAWRRGTLARPRGAILGVLILTLMAVSISLELWMQRVIAPHGRLLFPALSAISGALVVGWDGLHRRLALLAIAVLALLSILSPVTLIKPAYAPPGERVDEEDVGDGLATGPGWRFGQLAVLERIAPAADSVEAGQVLPISLCWRTLGRAEEDYSVLLHLVGPENRVVAGRRTYPGLGNYPTSTWETGRRFCDSVRVDIPADLPQTLLYKVEVAMIDQDSGERLPAYGEDDVSLSHTFASSVRLEAANGEQPIPEPPGQDPIRLVAADFPNQGRVGTTYSLSLRWWAAERLERDYTVFIHLRDPDSGGNVAQGDGPPVEGWYPTSAWEPGEVVEDNHAFILPDDLEPAEYALVVGWYDPFGGARLGDQNFLGTVQVLP